LNNCLNFSNDDNTSGDCDSISDPTSADTVDQDDLPQSNTMTAETSTLQTPADQPAADQPATDQPATDQPATDQPATDQPATDQPADMPTSDSNLNETSSVTDSVEAKDTSQSEATSSLEREADQPNSAAGRQFTTVICNLDTLSNTALPAHTVASW